MQDTLIKQRSSCATTISSILAAEKVAPALKDINAVKRVTVEVYERAKVGWYRRAPLESRLSGDRRSQHPYVVAAALMDGTVTPRQFNDSPPLEP